jgi:isopentenyl-diphosphate delta-isomerase
LSDGISQRKRDHLDLCADEAVEFSTKTTLFDQVDLVHDALPELALGDIALETTLLGKRLRAPLLITGMTGGTDEAAQINQDLARVAEECGIAFGLGSQRAMLRSPDLAYTFEVRAQAPTTLVLANLGVVQATSMPTAAVDALVRAVAADALCIHLNPAQELVQPGGDRDFRGGLETVRRLATELRVPVVVKETGCGISRAVARRLVDAGIRTVDVSGAGGTSWVRVETLRADEPAAALGREFAEWGIPTAAAVLAVRDLGLDCIASGGLRSGLDVAKAVALGARVAGVALPVLRAHREGGAEGARRVVERVLAGLRMAMLLTGARDLDALRRAPVVLGDSLRAWANVGDGNE